MATFTIPGQNIVANHEKDSPGVTVPSGLTSVYIQLTDPKSQWGTTVGNIKIWGCQQSFDGGATWSWGPIWQGDPANSATWIPFGTLDKSGGMPALRVSGGQLTVGGQVRLSILTDTNITLGAVVTVS